ncbi:uncharacterized protein LOC143427610 [Xylocopa sonorina]|uniref:uncharacterized protein LOC143427610 n=1 Tax=Xylocopa sonorina TaxID=1818115 RepID=UPI00403B2280
MFSYTTHFSSRYATPKFIRIPRNELNVINEENFGGKIEARENAYRHLTRTTLTSNINSVQRNKEETKFIEKKTLKFKTRRNETKKRKETRVFSEESTIKCEQTKRENEKQKQSEDNLEQSYLID